MPSLNPHTGALTLRILLDGPSFAGKTTSIRALGKALGREVSTPKESEGRTFFFDWLDWNPVNQDSGSLRCQIVTVPGQESRRKRRSLLLAGADAIIFVVDSTKDGIDKSEASLRQLEAFLEEFPEPRPPLLLQWNKRDEEGALPIAELQDRFRTRSDLPSVESVAIDGTGVAEVFRKAVRLAHERANQLAEAGLLSVESLVTENAAALLEGLQGAEKSEVSGLGAFGEERAPELEEARAVLARIAKLEAARLPARPTSEAPSDFQDLEIPAGGIWPASLGRSMVEETLAFAGPGGGLRKFGFTEKRFGPWTVGSLSRGSYQDKEEALADLRSWAGRCEESRRFLSSERWIAVLPGQEGELLLLQGVRQRPSLQEMSLHRVAGISDRVLLLQWVYLSAVIIQAERVFQGSPMPLPIDRHHVGLERSVPVYVGLIPGDLLTSQKLPDAVREVWSMVLKALSVHRCDAESLQSSLAARAFLAPSLRRAAREVGRVLLTLPKYPVASANLLSAKARG